MRPRLWTFVFCAFVPWAFTTGSTAEDAQSPSPAAWFSAHYTKFEYRVPMRDGVRLFTTVYRPKDESQAWPILLTRTPYSLKPYGPDQYPTPAGAFEVYARDRFILVSQDVRGRYASEGEFVHVRPVQANRGPRDTDETTDTWDSIDWLVKNVPGNNGKVGMHGISYPGFYTSMGMINSHPALRAASPQAPIADWFMGDDLHHNGAFFLSQNLGFINGFTAKVADPLHESAPGLNYGSPDGYDVFLRMGALANADKMYLKGSSAAWNEFVAHPNYDEWWQERNIRPRLTNVHCAVMTVGGWYDAEDFFGALETHAWTERLNPGLTNLLVIGPWVHGGWGRRSGEDLGPISFKSATGAFFREKVALPFFRHFLKDDPQGEFSKALVFETGTCRWRRFDAWPPRGLEARTVFLQPGGGLSFQSPEGGLEAFDEFLSDPAKPVPFTHQMTTGYPSDYMVEDQRFVATRPDVLVYQTEPLRADLTMAGPLLAALQVSTTGTDADWVVKVIDVYPNHFPEPEPNPSQVKMGGYQQLVRGDVFRGRFRQSFTKPVPFTPGQITEVKFTLPDVFHTFRSGHRLMVQVQSSWFPLVDRNPQTFVDIATAKPEDFRKAAHRVYRSGAAASQLSFSVLTPGSH